MADYATARSNMVDSQLRTNKVSDVEIIAAFEQVPRERFVPEPLRGIAYVDEDIGLGNGRCLMEPMVLARLLQAARPEPGDIVLDVGCASGYATAVLSRLVATVVALECEPTLAAEANQAFDDLGIDNAIVVESPLAEGYPKQAPYNVILIDGTVSEIPPAIADQLGDGGRLVTVVKDGNGVGRAILMERRGNVVSSRVLFDASVPFLPGFEAAPGFVF